MPHYSRRAFLATSAGAAFAGTVLQVASTSSQAAEERGDKMAFGLVTYMWGADWDLPTLLANCEQAGVHGVELRTTHRHGVEPTLSSRQRQQIRDRLADSAVNVVGLGSNERYDNPDPAVVAKAIAATKEFVVLSHDIGATGVKVKPDTFHKGVPHEKTIAQIGQALTELGEFAEGYGQQIRLEVHGGCAELPTIRAIMDATENENVFVCWNSNPQDLQGKGLAHNFGLVRPRFGSTCHVHELDSKSYPYDELFKLLVASDYDGWVLLEGEAKQIPEDRVAGLKKQRELFTSLVANARK